MNLPAAFPSAELWARGLTVRRGERPLFEGLEFAVKPGGVLLLRGANGAGKSTLLLTLAGIVRPDEGSFGYGGDDRTAIHFVGYQHGLKARLTVSENLAFWRVLNGPTGIGVDAALAAVGIGGLATLEAGYLSSGQLRRLALARLLVSQRPVWLLDEPVSALDAAGELLVGQLVDDHRARGGICVVATHHDLALAGSAEVATITLGLP